MLEALDSPDKIHPGTTSPGVPRPGPTWNARLRGLVTALETRVPGSAGHGRRVAAMGGLVAARLGLDPGEVTRVECAARVHDVGKIIVSPEILEKPGALSADEFAEMRRHAVFGARLVASLEDPALTAMVRHHHERIDGTGYPDRLRGEEIPLGARIIAVVDSYDALTARRPYREPASPVVAISILEEEAGRTLDGEVVAAFIA
ncbi:MAG TPA: HD-GYP domain-containing protein [Solirubrobacterales bacterium]|nr:HD-GYP domain-containing protein [Solirubrobacterales bacterium]